MCTYHLLKKKKKGGMELWQWHCRNRMEKKNLQLVCGNAIAKIGGNFFFFFGNCAKNGKEKKKLFPKSGKELKKSATSTIFLQHFHNKLQVISYY